MSPFQHEIQMTVFSVYYLWKEWKLSYPPLSCFCLSYHSHRSQKLVPEIEKIERLLNFITIMMHNVHQQPSSIIARLLRDKGMSQYLKQSKINVDQPLCHLRPISFVTQTNLAQEVHLHIKRTRAI